MSEETGTASGAGDLGDSFFFRRGAERLGAGFREEGVRILAVREAHVGDLEAEALELGSELLDCFRAGPITVETENHFAGSVALQQLSQGLGKALDSK